MATYYARLEGALPGGERWATGHHFTGAGTVGDVLTDAVTSAGLLWNGNGSTIPGLITHYTAATTLTSVVVYELDESSGKASARAEQGVTHVGTGTGSPLPQEVAVCATLRTATPGPRGRGRSFLPPPVVADVLATGRLDSLAAGDFAESLAGYLSNMVASSWSPVLFTPGIPSRDIITVDVGDVFDAQRRRRDKLVETRTSAAV